MAERLGSSYRNGRKSLVGDTGSEMAGSRRISKTLLYIWLADGTRENKKQRAKKQMVWGIADRPLCGHGGERKTE